MVIHKLYCRIAVNHLYPLVIGSLDIYISVPDNDLKVQSVISRAVKVYCHILGTGVAVFFKILQINPVVYPVIKIIVCMVGMIVYDLSVFEFYDPGCVKLRQAPLRESPAPPACLWK